MPDWFDKIVAFIKLPLKFLWVAVVFSGLTLFLPTEMIKEFGLDVLLENYRPWLGVLFIFSSCLVVIEALKIGWQRLKNNRKKAIQNSKLLRHLFNLDPHEKSVLREFIILDRNTLQLPCDNPTISGMISDGVLEIIGSSGERSLAGILMAVKINPIVKDFMTNEIIDLPNLKNINQSDAEWLNNNRPEFVSEIEDHNRVFHRRW